MFHKCLSRMAWIGVVSSLTLAAQDSLKEVTLDQAIEIALARHADLEAARAAVDARQGALRQADLPPNPSISFQSENWRFWGQPGFSAGSDLDLFLFVTQPIETAGKRQRRVNLAQKDERLAELQQQAVAWRIRQDVKRAYWRLLAAQRKEQHLSDSMANFQRIVDYHQTRVRLGAMAESDLIKVRLEGERIAMDLQAAGMERDRAGFALLQAMGVSEVRQPVRGRQQPLPKPSATWANAHEELVELALESRYEAQLAKAMVEQARAFVGVAQSEAKPNVTPYFGYKRSGVFNTVVGGISVPLPFFDRNQGRIDETTAEVDQAQAKLRAVRARIRAEVASALAAVERRAEMLHTIQTGMLQRANETSRIALAAYQEGGADMFRLLDAQRSLQEIQLLHAGLSFEHKLSQLDLESAVGSEDMPVPEQRRPLAGALQAPLEEALTTSSQFDQTMDKVSEAASSSLTKEAPRTQARQR